MGTTLPPPFVVPASALLTPRQAELLAYCIKRGYYEIPRHTTLRDIGAELGITATSLSLALRRAENKIIQSYMAASVAATSGLGATGLAAPVIPALPASPTPAPQAPPKPTP